MKVVINNAFGGFGLSVDAQKRIAELGCPHAKWVDEDEYFSELGRESRTRVWGSEEKARGSHCSFCGIPRENGQVLLDEHKDAYEKPTVRACPILIKVVEEMNEQANGKHASLKIVEVPDDVEWAIKEYDGNEWVAEKHRTWS